MKRGKTYKSVTGRTLFTLFAEADDKSMPQDKLFVTITDPDARPLALGLGVSQVEQLASEMAAWAHAQRIGRSLNGHGQ